MLYELHKHRSMKIVCFVLFCSYKIQGTRMLHIVFLMSLESSRQGGVHGLGSMTYDIWTCSAKVLEYWMISSLKIKLNHSWKFQRNWNVPLGFLGRYWWAGLNGIYLVRFGFTMWEILICKWFLPLNIQINSKKPGKISWGRDNTWAKGTGHTSIYESYFLYFMVCPFGWELCKRTNENFVMGFIYWRKMVGWNY
jgi:hypothetical protein